MSNQAKPHVGADTAPTRQAPHGPSVSDVLKSLSWKAKANSEETRKCLSVLLDDPSFPEPIRVAQFEDDALAYLVWDRKQS